MPTAPAMGPAGTAGWGKTQAPVAGWVVMKSGGALRSHVAGTAHSGWSAYLADPVPVPERDHYRTAPDSSRGR